MAPLYHGTDIHSLGGILINNVIRSDDDDNVSLTRNFKFAKNWAENRTHNSSDWVVIEFDQLKLNTRYKIKPFNFHGDFIDGKTRYSPNTDWVYDVEDDHGIDRNQFEEQVKGSIRDPLKYITKIYMTQKSRDRIKKGAPKYYKMIGNLINVEI